jgi:type II secretory pathway pseudopilin PulG
VVRGSFLAKRFAFTMIELIFAIVIIGITVVSLPMMMQITDKGIEENLVQEAVFVGAAEVMEATTAYWDANSMQDSNVSAFSRVINISGDCDATTKLRPGHIAQPYHRRCLENNTTAPADDTSSVISLDGREKTDSDVFLENYTTTAAGYKKTYTRSVDVNRSNNIKTITVSIKENGTPITVLRTQSANIGEIDYFKRSF